MKRIQYLLMILLFLGCNSAEPILIGTVFTVTGDNPQLGVSTRNGLDLAIKEWNDKGGLLGRPIEAKNFNPESNPDKIPEIMNELESLGIQLVLGPLTSNLASTTLASLRGRDMLVISPTITTYQVAGLDDNFLRVTMSSDQEGLLIGRWLRQTEQTKLALIFDANNRDFASSILIGLREGYGDEDLQFLYQNDMDSRDRDYRRIAREAVESGAQSIFIIAGSLDNVALAQQIYKENFQGTVIGSQWGSTGDVISQGGRAVEGMVFVHDPLQAKTGESYLAFSRAYMSFFGREPDFSAQYSYEAAQILFESISKTGSQDPSTIKNSILEESSFEGLTGEILFDRFGDISREKILVQIMDGAFAPLEK